MPFPTTRQALEEHGYSFVETKICPSCNVSISMWNTPKGNLMPLDFGFFASARSGEESEICVPHFATCKNPELYSRKLRERAEKKKAAEDSPMTP